MYKYCDEVHAIVYKYHKVLANKESYHYAAKLYGKENENLDDVEPAIKCI
jgi:hypothetical protein